MWPGRTRIPVGAVSREFQILLFFFDGLNVPLEFGGDINFPYEHRLSDDDFRNARGGGNASLCIYLCIDLLVCLVVPDFKFPDIHIRVFFCDVFYEGFNFRAVRATLAIEIIDDVVADAFRRWHGCQEQMA